MFDLSFLLFLYRFVSSKFKNTEKHSRASYISLIKIFMVKQHNRVKLSQSFFDADTKK